MFAAGCHLSVGKGYANMGAEALSLGADDLQFFCSNPRSGRPCRMDPDDVAQLRGLVEQGGIRTVMAHAPYVMNLCSAKPANREAAMRILTYDLHAMENLPGSMYNLHPGSHTGQGVEVGIGQIAAGLNAVLWPGMLTTVLLETMSGKGSEVGGRFEELSAIIKRVDLAEKLGVCLDTCHVWDAGYDLAGDLDGVLERFDRTIGLGHLKAIHLNDSKNACGSRKDRHEKLGEGCIGLEALGRIVSHPFLRDLPFFLETPNDLDGYRKEIALIRCLHEEG